MWLCVGGQLVSHAFSLLLLTQQAQQADYEQQYAELVRAMYNFDDDADGWIPVGERRSSTAAVTLSTHTRIGWNGFFHRRGLGVHRDRKSRARQADVGA